MTDELEQKEPKRVKAKRHVRKHKKKYGAAAVVAALIALLELVPHVRHFIVTGDTKPLAEFGKTKLIELQDAGIITE